ncbi:MAG: alkaline phosphatase family protein [Microbacteriaceae bacterium]|nr:alkaline phosphatase family protein [Microbacteriaceae bacterium]
MLPAAKTSRFSLADVLPNCLDALRGRRGRLGLGAVTHAVVVLADGLGRRALETHRGHARTLASRLDADPAIAAGFPTTTASALATLTTGRPPGTHGMVGYRALDPARGVVVPQLTLDGVDPAIWQREPTLFESAEDVRSIAIASPRHRVSALTRAVLRGAEYVGAASTADRFREARRMLAEPGPALIYLYVAELDVEGHARGVGSPRWLAALEELDAQTGGLVREMGERQGMLVTADHGMTRVPPEGQRIVPPELLAGVRQVAGEPRCLHLHLEPGIEADAVAASWREAEGPRAWVATRDEAIGAGWFGETDPAVRPRIGDVLVAARTGFAYYVDADDTGRRMVGQHGSFGPEEQEIPLLRFGAFAA